LDNLHRLTSQRSFSLKIIMTDYDGKSFVAVYDQFKVGQGPGYVLRVGGFDNALSTLGDSFRYNNGMMFSAKLVEFYVYRKALLAQGQRPG